MTPLLLGLEGSIPAILLQVLGMLNYLFRRIKRGLTEPVEWQSYEQDAMTICVVLVS
jgi:hypothetical protein